MIYDTSIDAKPFRADRNLWLKRNELGAVYTPKFLADWVSRLLLEFMPHRKPLVVLDPACGDGELLYSVASATRRSVDLIGVDVRAEALSRARRRLKGAKLYRQDFLAPDLGTIQNCGPEQHVAAVWKTILRHTQPTGIIANPPWGASVSASREGLKSKGILLARGQFDSFELFLELSVQMANPGTVVAFIVPDSLFFPEHEPLRQFLLENTEMLLLARLGEGFFPEVFRGTAVLVLRKNFPSAKHTVECFRLNASWRIGILKQQISLNDARLALSHPVSQSRFKLNSAFRFDLDIRKSEEKTIFKIQQYATTWVDWFVQGRGIELSKKGSILTCPSCNHAIPTPRHRDSANCVNCKIKISVDPVHKKTIVRRRTVLSKKWHPLIVGEDVDRYACEARHEIALNYEGINYKSKDIFKSRKLLIRKTGVGLKAAIDESGAFTNQVVFHYAIDPERPVSPFLLDYVLGVFCSRVLFAFHLKRLGEMEWRSHAYITQEIIATLPIPRVQPGTWQWKQAQYIAAAARTRQTQIQSHDSQTDIYIDCLVAGLFELSSDDCMWVNQVLADAQSLEPVRSLRLADPSKLEPLRIA